MSTHFLHFIYSKNIQHLLKINLWMTTVGYIHTLDNVMVERMLPLLTNHLLWGKKVNRRLTGIALTSTIQYKGGLWLPLAAPRGGVNNGSSQSVSIGEHGELGKVIGRPVGRKIDWNYQYWGRGEEEEGMGRRGVQRREEKREWGGGDVLQVLWKLGIIGCAGLVIIWDEIGIGGRKKGSGRWVGGRKVMLETFWFVFSHHSHWK